MSKNLLNLSGKIDSLTLELLDYITEVTETLGIPYFIVGATARDIIFSHYNIKTVRATDDIDFAVQVDDWKQYNNLKKGLIESKKFEVTNKEQRLKFDKKLLIDIVPFGAIVDQSGLVFWPPDHEIKMNALGFKEAFRNAITVKVREEPLLKVLFSSLAGLAIMKLISWDDMYPERKKDARDLGFIINNYLDAGNQERFFEEAIDILNDNDGDDFDYLKAGARLLGRDMAAIAISETKAKIEEILERETGAKDRYRLVEDMRDFYQLSNVDFEEYLELLEKLKLGLKERT